MIRPFFIAVFTVLIFALSPLCRGALAADHEVVNGIAAIVNGDVITYSQVRELVEPRERLLRSQFQGEELVAKIKEARLAALKDLIDRQLIIQSFNKEGYQIPEHYVEQEIESRDPRFVRGRSEYFYQNAPGAELHARRVHQNGEGENDGPGHAREKREADDRHSAGKDR